MTLLFLYAIAALQFETHSVDNEYYLLINSEKENISFSSFRLSNPERIIVEINGEHINQENIPPGVTVKKVKIKDSPDKVRLIFYIKKNSFYNILNRKNSLLIGFRDTIFIEEEGIDTVLARIKEKQTAKKALALKRINKKIDTLSEQESKSAEDKLVAHFLKQQMKPSETMPSEKLNKNKQQELLVSERQKRNEKKKKQEEENRRKEAHEKQLAILKQQQEEKKKQLEQEEKRRREEEKLLALLKQKQEKEKQRLMKEEKNRKAEEKRLVLRKKKEKEEERKRMALLKQKEEEKKRRLDAERIKREAEEKRLALLKKKQEEEKKQLEQERLEREAEERSLAEEKRIAKLKEQEERKQDVLAGKRNKRRAVKLDKFGKIKHLKVVKAENKKQLDNNTPALKVVKLRKKGSLQNIYFRKYPEFSRVTLEATGDLEYRFREIQGGYVIDVTNVKRIPKYLLNIIDARAFYGEVKYIYPKKKDKTFKIYIKTDPTIAVRKSKDGQLINFDFFEPTIE